MKKIVLRSLRLLTLTTSAFSLIIFASCKDDDPKCDEIALYADADGDGLGSAEASAMISACKEKEGYVTNAYDNNDNEDFSGSSLLDLVETLPELDSLEKYLSVYPNLTALLDNAGTYTVFLPTNAAFAGLLETPGFPQDISTINPDIIEGVLAYHVAGTVYGSTDLTSGKKITTLSQAQQITVNADGTLLTGSSNSNIQIEVADITTSNGVGHIVSSVLISPAVGQQLTPLLNTNGGTLMLGSDFSILAQAIQKADTFATANSQTTILSIISGETAHTFFAPSNGTFETVADSLFGNLDHTASETEINTMLNYYGGSGLYGLLTTHIVMSEVQPSALTAGATLTAQSGATLTVLTVDAPTNPAKGILTGIAIDSNGDTEAEAQVAVPSTASASLDNPNGLIHVIAGLLSPPAN